MGYDPLVDTGSFEKESLFRKSPIGLEYDFKNLLLDQRRLLGTVSNLSALAAAKWVRLWMPKRKERLR